MTKPLLDEAKIHSALLAVMDAQEQIAGLLRTLRVTLDVCTLASGSLGDLGQQELIKGLENVEEAKRKLEDKLVQIEGADLGSEAKLLLNRLGRH